jgi:hypothetical protein
MLQRIAVTDSSLMVVRPFMRFIKVHNFILDHFQPSDHRQSVAHPRDPQASAGGAQQPRKSFSL